MKRSKKIEAETEYVKVVVEVSINTREGYLVRSEINTMAEEITSDIMRQLSGTRYLGIPISQIEILR